MIQEIYKKSQNIFFKYIDSKEPYYPIFYVSSFLIIIGVVFSYSLGTYAVSLKGYNEFHFLIRQSIVGFISILLMYVFAQIRPEVLIPKISWLLFSIFGVLILLLPFLPDFLASSSGGAKRWIRLPFISISPTEFFKIGMIYFLAFSFSRKLMGISSLPFWDEVKKIIPYILFFMVFILFVAVFQKDLGNTFLIALIIFVMFILLGVSGKTMGMLVTISGLGLVFLVVFQGHRVKRILSWWSGVQDTILNYFPDFLVKSLTVEHYPEPYQVNMSLDTMHQGGLFGSGIGEGVLKLGYLPEVHTDFVLAGITEEIGIIGLFVITFLFTLLFTLILKVSNRSSNEVYKLFGVGIALTIMLTFLINFMGITGQLPMKGIAVPFLSYGGSSLLSSSIAIGLILSISKDMVK